MSSKIFKYLAMVSVPLAIVVVMLGAYTRLGDAGLGCPDWPGCYGQIDVPETHHEIAKANQAYPDRPVEPAKAWKEMIHRYFAGMLGLLVFAMAILAIKNRRDPQQQVAVPVFLAFWIVFQALLGMWTVTIKLNPTIVMAHLMGGLATLSLLFWISLRHTNALIEKRLDLPRLNRLHMLALVALVAVLVIQLVLGVSNIIFSLPMAIAVSHNAVGAVLLLVMVAINHAIRPKDGVL